MFIADYVSTDSYNNQYGIVFDVRNTGAYFPNMGLRERIKEELEKRKWTQNHLSDVSGVPQPTIQRFMRGIHGEPRGDTVRKLAAGFGITEGELRGLSKEITLPNTPADAVIEFANEDDYAFVPLYDVRASAGNGHPVEHELIKGTLAFQREWLRDKGLAVKNLSVIYAHGKSMEPRINDGDVLLVDASQRDIKDGKIYAIRWHGELRIKRLVRDYDGSVRIISDNKSPDYPEQHVPADALDQLEIIGRVVWMGGDL